MRVLVLVIALAACGEDSHGGAYVPVEMYNSAYKDAYCTHEVACGLFADHATCVATTVNTGPLMEISPDYVAAVLAGKMYFEGGKFATCVAAIAKLSCDLTSADNRAPIATCANLFRGTVAGNGECSLDLECVSQTCARNCGELTCCMGTCLGNTPPDVVPPKAIGESCVGESCVATAFCDSGSQICTALLPMNSPCTTSSQCGFGLGCVQSSPQVCAPFPALGQACPNFVSPLCRDDGQYCDQTTQICKAVGLPGTPCVPNAALNTCSPYYRCDEGTSTCVALPGVGEMCQGVSCGTDLELYCDTPSLICKARHPAGDTCTSSNECADGLTCDATQNCVALPACI